MIKLVAFSQNWAMDFNELKTMLQNLLGPLATRIDHIGSTSIPGLVAKDVIDIQVSVQKLTDQIKLLFESAGFEFNAKARDHIPEWIDDHSPKHWKKFLFSMPLGSRRAHIHIRVNKSFNQRYALLFRDYLRTHPQVIPTIGLIKTRLASLTQDIENYLSVKDPVYDLIVFAAEEWATRTGWTSL